MDYPRAASPWAAVLRFEGPTWSLVGVHALACRLAADKDRCEPPSPGTPGQPAPSKLAPAYHPPGNAWMLLRAPRLLRPTPSRYPTPVELWSVARQKIGLAVRRLLAWQRRPDDRKTHWPLPNALQSPDAHTPNSNPNGGRKHPDARGGPPARSLDRSRRFVHRPPREIESP